MAANLFILFVYKHPDIVGAEFFRPYMTERYVGFGQHVGAAEAHGGKAVVEGDTHGFVALFGGEALHLFDIAFLGESAHHHIVAVLQAAYLKPAHIPGGDYGTGQCGYRIYNPERIRHSLLYKLERVEPRLVRRLLPEDELALRRDFRRCRPSRQPAERVAPGGTQQNGRKTGCNYDLPKHNLQI